MRTYVTVWALLAGCLLALGCGAASSSSRSSSTASSTSSSTASSTATSTPTSNQGGGAEVFRADSLGRTADRLGTATGQTIGATATRKYIVGRRVVTGAAEMHQRWTDVVFVQAGRATLVSGGKVQSAKEESAGETRGPGITGGTEKPVGAGDLVIIPTGMPHQYVLARGDTLRYLTIKVLEGAP